MKNKTEMNFVDAVHKKNIKNVAVWQKSVQKQKRFELYIQQLGNFPTAKSCSETL